MLFTLLLAVLTGVRVSDWPRRMQAPKAVNDALKEQHRGSTNSRKHAWIRGALVVSEIVFACVLMVARDCLLRSFLRVLDVNLGFQPAHAAAMRIDPSARFSTAQQVTTYLSEALRRVRELNGVEAAGVTDALPLGRNRTWGAAAKGVVYKRGEYPLAFVHIVSDGYLKAMGIPLIAGRDFSERDTTATESVILINETLARTFVPGRKPAWTPDESRRR